VVELSALQGNNTAAPIYSIDFHPDGSRFATGGGDYKVSEDESLSGIDLQAYRGLSSHWCNDLSQVRLWSTALLKEFWEGSSDESSQSLRSHSDDEEEADLDGSGNGVQPPHDSQQKVSVKAKG